MLDLAPRHLILLADSAAALHRLKCFKKEFRPGLYNEIGDSDIVDTIVRAIGERERKGPHLTLADQLATTDTDRHLSKGKPHLFPVPNATTMGF